MSEVPVGGDERKPGPSTRQHLFFVVVCWAMLPFVYWEDYGWPGSAPRVPYGGNWITLDLTGLATMAYAWFAVIYSGLATIVFVRARRRPRRMSWVEYLILAPLSVLGLLGAWYLYLVLD